MANRYEDKSNAELIEMLEMRDLSWKGKKTDIIARLLEFDSSIQRSEKAVAKDPTNPDLSMISGRFLLYNSETSGTRSTCIRIQRILQKHQSSYELIDISRCGHMHVFWNKESKGRRLPALLKQGQIIGNLCRLRSWIDSGDLSKCINDACEQVGVGIEDPDDLPESLALLGPPPEVPPEYAGLLLAQGLLAVELTEVKWSRLEIKSTGARFEVKN